MAHCYRKYTNFINHNQANILCAPLQSNPRRVAGWILQVIVVDFLHWTKIARRKSHSLRPPPAGKVIDLAAREMFMPDDWAHSFRAVPYSAALMMRGITASIIASPGHVLPVGGKVMLIYAVIIELFAVCHRMVEAEGSFVSEISQPNWGLECDHNNVPSDACLWRGDLKLITSRFRLLGGYFDTNCWC